MCLLSGFQATWISSRQLSLFLFYDGISGKPKTSHFCIQNLDCLYEVTCHQSTPTLPNFSLPHSSKWSPVAELVTQGSQHPSLLTQHFNPGHTLPIEFV